MKNGRIRFPLIKKQILRIMLAAAVCLVAAKAWSGGLFPRLTMGFEMPKLQNVVWDAGELLLRHIWNQFYPEPPQSGGERNLAKLDGEADPAYRAAKAAETFWREHEYLALYGNEETKLDGNGADSEGMDGSNTDGAATSAGLSGAGVDSSGAVSQGTAVSGAPSFPAAASSAGFPGQTYQLAQLEDYDFLMKHFYSVHTSTTAGRDLMDARKLLSRNFQLELETESSAAPQILIYHTHSQEAFADSKEGENIVAVGDYLAELLTQKGFSVYHDRSVYDVRDGKLDRNRAYTYALEGISRILEENPSIQVVIDLHRDGVSEKTRLVTEVNGKSTAQIMFFNGLSQTPDGPIPYLENPNREDNLAFSLQLQLKAAAYYPGFTRKIYLKGLRYNMHLRPRSCLIEAGAQTNTYEEVKNAMEPLAEVFTMVLRGN